MNSRLYYWIFIRFWIYKNHHRLIAVDLSRQKELGADPKAIQQIEFVGEWKKLNADANPESMLVLTILEEIKVTRLNFFSRNCNTIIKGDEFWRS